MPSTRSTISTPALSSAALHRARQVLGALGVDAIFQPSPATASWLTDDAIRARSAGGVQLARGINFRTHERIAEGLFCPKLFGDLDDTEQFAHIPLACPIPHPLRLHELSFKLGIAESDLIDIAFGTRDFRNGRVVVDPDLHTLEHACGPALQHAIGEDGMLSVIPVLPVGLRAFAPEPSIGADLNDLYRLVLTRSNRLRRLGEIGAPNVVLRNEMRMVFESVGALFDNERGVGTAVCHEGRVRTSLAGHLKQLLRPASSAGTPTTGWCSALLRGQDAHEALVPFGLTDPLTDPTDQARLALHP